MYSCQISTISMISNQLIDVFRSFYELCHRFSVVFQTRSQDDDSIECLNVATLNDNIYEEDVQMFTLSFGENSLGIALFLRATLSQST